MALNISPRRRNAKGKLAGALFAILALFVQPLVTLNLPSAFAASVSVTPSSFTVGSAETKTSNADASAFSNLSLSFSHVAENLETGDTLVYGWKEGSGGTDHQLGVIDGQPNTGGNPGVGENGSKNIALPSSAQVSDLVLYFTNTGSTGSGADDVQISSISISGDVIEQNSVCGSGCEWTNLVDAINGEATGSTITVKAGTYTQTTGVNVNKQLTINGQPGAVISTSGTTQLFTVTAAGVTFNGLSFTKIDNLNQVFIGVQANNVTLSNNTFSAQYSLAANAGTTRAFVASTPASGLTVSGNSFERIRQPAYINNLVSGTINNNYVNDTRGWVIVSDSNLSFTGNTWGTNATDIAIINQDNSANNYTCSVMEQIKQDNNNASIDNQVLVRNCVTPPTEQTTVVSLSDLKGWAGVDDNSNGGSLDFVSGPGTPPLGTGSARLSVTNSTQGYMLAKSAYGGTKLKDIGDISYSTYGSTGNNLWAPSVQINVTPDVSGTAAWYGRLVYEPYMNGTVTDGQWQAWNADDGKWWLSKPSSFGNHCAQSDPCTFEQLIGYYPNIGVNTGVYAGVGFKAGSSWSNYVGSVDNFHFSSVTANDRYNFERYQAPVISNVDYDTPEQGQTTVTVTLSEDAEVNLNSAVTFVRFTGGNELVGGAQTQSSKYAVTKIDGRTYKAIVNTKDFVPDGAEGKYIVYASIQATNGTKDFTTSSPERMYIDNKAPVISNVTVANPANGQINVDVTLDDSHAILEDDRFTFVRFVTGRDLTGGATANSVKYGLTQLSSNVYRATINTDDFSPNGTGRYVLYVSAQDVLGNKGVDNSTRDVIVDNEAPAQTTITSPTNNQEFTANPGGDTIQATWNPVTGAILYEIRYQYLVGGVPTTTTRTTTDTYRDQQLSGTITGKFTIDVRAKDAAGNWSAWSDAVDYFYGATTPTTEEPTDPEDTNGGTDGGDTGGAINTNTDDPVIPPTPINLLSNNNPATSFVFVPNGGTGTNPTTGQTGPENGEVLGTQDATTPLESTAALSPSTNGWKLWGVAWYWYLLIAAFIAALWWLIAGLRRRNQDQM